MAGLNPEDRVIADIDALVDWQLAQPITDDYDSSWHDHEGDLECPVCLDEWHGLPDAYGCPGALATDEAKAAYTPIAPEKCFNPQLARQYQRAVDERFNALVARRVNEVFRRTDYRITGREPIEEPAGAAWCWPTSNADSFIITTTGDVSITDGLAFIYRELDDSGHRVTRVSGYFTLRGFDENGMPTDEQDDNDPEDPTTAPEPQEDPDTADGAVAGAGEQLGGQCGSRAGPAASADLGPLHGGAGDGDP